MQSKSSKTIRFSFPPKAVVDQFKQLLPKPVLFRKILQLRQLPQYNKNIVRFRFHRGKSDNTINCYKIYFYCCKQNPKIFFTSKDCKNFTIDLQRSDLNHIHDQNVKQYIQMRNKRGRKTKNIKKNKITTNNRNIGLNITTSQEQEDKKNRMQQQPSSSEQFEDSSQSQKQLLDRLQRQSSQQQASQSNQQQEAEQQVSQKQQINNIEQFIFPPQQEMRIFKGKLSPQQIQEKMQKLIKSKQFIKRGIKYRSMKWKIKNTNIYRWKYYFACCLQGGGGIAFVSNNKGKSFSLDPRFTFTQHKHKKPYIKKDYKMETQKNHKFKIGINKNISYNNRDSDRIDGNINRVNINRVNNQTKGSNIQKINKKEDIRQVNTNKIQNNLVLKNKQDNQQRRKQNIWDFMKKNRNNQQKQLKRNNQQINNNKKIIDNSKNINQKSRLQPTKNNNEEQQSNSQQMLDQDHQIGQQHNNAQQKYKNMEIIGKQIKQNHLMAKQKFKKIIGLLNQSKDNQQIFKQQKRNPDQLFSNKNWNAYKQRIQQQNQYGQDQQQIQNMNNIQKGNKKSEKKIDISENSIYMSVLLEWYDKMNIQISNRILQNKNERIDMRQICIKISKQNPFSYIQLFDKYNNESKQNNQQKNNKQKQKTRKIQEQLWNQSIKKLLQLNNFSIISLDNQNIDPNPGSCRQSKQLLVNQLVISNHFKNLIKFNQNLTHSKKHFPYLNLYITILPLTLDNSKYQILLIYSLNQHFQPQLISFSIYSNSLQPNNFQLQDYLKNKSQSKHLINILSIFINYIYPNNGISISNNNQKIKFIYTTLNQNLIRCLYLLQKKYLSHKIQTEIIFAPHIYAFKYFLNQQFISQNSNLILQISNQIQISSYSQQIEQSYEYLMAKTFHSQQDQQNITNRQLQKRTKNQINKSFISQQKKQILNPQQVYQHFNIFKSILSSNDYLLKYKQYHFLQFICRQLFPQHAKFYIQDPVSDIIQNFNQVTSFNNQSQLLAFLLSLFNQKTKRELKLLKGSTIASNEKFWRQKQMFFTLDMFGGSQTLSSEVVVSLQHILNEPRYGFQLIIQQCPRLIIQTLYRLIIASKRYKFFQISQFLVQESYNQKNIYYAQDILQRNRFKINYYDNQHEAFQQQRQNSQMQQIHNFSLKINKVSNNKDKKKWICQCKFSQFTGIPCEHEICCILENGHSFYNQIHLM